jgi:hypothetical protein
MRMLRLCKDASLLSVRAAILQIHKRVSINAPFHSCAATSEMAWSVAGLNGSITKSTGFFQENIVGERIGGSISCQT